MKKVYSIILLTLISTILFSTIINIPGDQPTIQDGIDVAVDSDTVLVQPGIYYENINYNGKNITVTSIFLTTQDTTYISQTVIDGNQNGSVVRFMNEENSNAVLSGFTIKNGTGQFYNSPGANARFGGGIYCFGSSPSIINLIITSNTALNATFAWGGGVYIYGEYQNPSSLYLSNTKIINNSADDGGGIYLYGCTEAFLNNVEILNNNGNGINSEYSNLNLSDVSIVNNSSGGLSFIAHEGVDNLVFDTDNRCSIYNNLFTNTRGYGVDIYTEDCGLVNVVLDTFTVLTPTDYYASPIENLTFDILHGINDLVNADLFVATDGDNSNSGLTANEPLLNIMVALSKIYGDSLNQNTIYLLPGTYSQSTNGEIFPIRLNSNISLDGESENQTILDAEETATVIEIDYAYNNWIKNLSIVNGLGKGGAFKITSSDISLSNLIISDNNSHVYNHVGANSSIGAGGINCINSTLFVNNISILNNSGLSGGLYCSDSQVSLKNSIIDNNCAGDYEGGYGGGICIIGCPNIEINNSIISNNVCSGGLMGAGYGAGLYIEGSDISMINVEISNNTTPYGFGGGMICIN